MILLRLIPTAAHTDAEIEETLDAFDAIHDKLVNGVYKKQAEALNMDYTPL